MQVTIKKTPENKVKEFKRGRIYKITYDDDSYEIYLCFSYDNNLSLISLKDGYLWNSIHADCNKELIDSSSDINNFTLVPESTVIEIIT